MYNRILGACLAIAWLAAASAHAACSAFPNTLTNGATADASQVMANLNCLLNSPAFTGPVGIGTTGPSYEAAMARLAIVGTAGQDATTLAESNTKAAVSIRGNSSSGYTLAMGAATGDVPYLQGVTLNGGGASANLFLNPFGSNVGIGTVTPATLLDVKGDITAYGGIKMADSYGTKSYLFEQSNNFLVLQNTDSSGSLTPIFYQQSDSTGAPFVFISPVYVPSDERLKKNITPVSGALADIQKLRPVRYQWRAKSERTVGKDLGLAEGEPQIGFVAQELAQVVPEAVNAPINKDDIYTVKEDNLIPLLVQAIKEQQAEIDSLKAQIASSKPAGS
jgi:hypothetical protein